MKAIKFSIADDEQEAINEAVGHLEACAIETTDQQEKDAYRRIAKRIRRMKPSKEVGK